jgi:hypothetical protein
VSFGERRRHSSSSAQRLQRACGESRRTPADRVGSRRPLRPRRGGASTSQGRPRTVFGRALQSGNLVAAEGMARELGRISLAEALELTILIGRKEPRRLARVAVRWLERYLQECEPTLANVSLAVSALQSLAEEKPTEAIRVLRSLVGSF